MDSFAFDKFWAMVAPFEMPSGSQSFTPPDYPTFFTTTQPKYLSTVPRDNIYRQFLSLWFITVRPLALPYHSVPVSSRILPSSQTSILHLHIPNPPIFDQVLINRSGYSASSSTLSSPPFPTTWSLTKPINHIQNSSPVKSKKKSP